MLPRRPEHSDRPSLLPIAIGTISLYLIMSALGSLTGSLCGEAGLAICVIVIVASLAAEWLLFGVPPRRALDLLGLARLPGDGLMPVLLVSAPLLAYYPVLGLLSGSAIPLREGWLLTAIGVFLQGGVAEEVIWRGFLFRHLRCGRDFWRASLVTMLFMVAAHAVLVESLDPLTAGVAIAVSAVIVFPMCHLFELDRGAIWSVALLHAAVQGLPKLFEPQPQLSPLSIVGWALLTTLVPLILFAFPRPRPTPVPERVSTAGSA
jgi:membrane protease YdiL (CAAX protease family)